MSAERQTLMEVADELVRIYKEQLGRGPDRTKAYWAGSDILIVVLEGTLTPAEKRLREMGELQRLRETRLFFQYASVREFCEPVERLTGRRVRAFVSGIDAAEDVSTETFVLDSPA